jgi:ABC-type sugar transport system substrate-binding protein
MTTPSLASLRGHPNAPRLPSPAPRPARVLGRPGVLAAIALAALAALAVALTPISPPATSRPARVALVMDAGPSPARALAGARGWAARAERRGGVDATVRLPRTAAEALTDVRYFAAQGYDRIVVAGPRSTAAAEGPAVVRAADLPAALAAVTR